MDSGNGVYIFSFLVSFFMLRRIFGSKRDEDRRMEKTA
jgi:hypothetical protein